MIVVYWFLGLAVVLALGIFVVSCCRACGVISFGPQSDVYVEWQRGVLVLDDAGNFWIFNREPLLTADLCGVSLVRLWHEGGWHAVSFVRNGPGDVIYSATFPLVQGMPVMIHR